MDLMAIYDALNCASLAVLQAEDGNTHKAEESHREASVAALGAFPDGSPEAHALNVILGAVGDLARGVAA